MANAHGESKQMRIFYQLKFYKYQAIRLSKCSDGNVWRSGACTVMATLHEEGKAVNRSRLLNMQYFQRDGDKLGEIADVQVRFVG